MNELKFFLNFFYCNPHCRPADDNHHRPKRLHRMTTSFLTFALDRHKNLERPYSDARADFDFDDDEAAGMVDDYLDGIDVVVAVDEVGNVHCHDVETGDAFELRVEHTGLHRRQNAE